MQNQQGFTLIELMIVIAVILIIVAIAIPGILNAKMNANETSAVGSVRSINIAQVSYQTAYPTKGFAGSLTALGGPDECTPTPETACLIDPDLSSGTKSGYAFITTAEKSANQANIAYLVGAAPLVFKHTGVHRYCSTEKNLIRRDDNAQGSTTLPSADECRGFTRLQ